LRHKKSEKEFYSYREGRSSFEIDGRHLPGRSTSQSVGSWRAVRSVRSVSCRRVSVRLKTVRFTRSTSRRESSTVSRAYLPNLWLCWSSAIVATLTTTRDDCWMWSNRRVWRRPLQSSGRCCRLCSSNLDLASLSWIGLPWQCRLVRLMRLSCCSSQHVNMQLI